eukprot:TRINITY_DN663_c0_g1_i1.p1 TRINITY_DN663_c0_g1~~TRINITY_DN663_c0_g1_i1.p1  ORF type:complete len:607 (-),score=86.54 TRINITY_DN663_c0_g1_i1:193-1953(-)
MFFLLLMLCLPALLLSHRVFMQRSLQALQPGSQKPLSDDCRALFSSMLAECKKSTNSSSFIKAEWGSCDTAIASVWFTNSSFTKEQHEWVFETFLNNTKLKNKTVLTPVFWTGFAFRTGTRRVMDDIISALPGCDGEAYLCADVEHKDSPLGRLMRKGDWHRVCHGTQEDKQVWVHVSEAFSYKRQKIQNELGAIQEHVKSGPVVQHSKAAKLALHGVAEQLAKAEIVHVLVNKAEGELNTTFLFEYELPILVNASSTPKLKFWNFKSTCGNSFKELVPRSLRTGMTCTSFKDFPPLPNSSTDPWLNTMVDLHWKMKCMEDASEDKIQIECCKKGTPACLEKAIRNDQPDQIRYFGMAFPKLFDHEFEGPGLGIHSDLLRTSIHSGKFSRYGCLHLAAAEGRLEIVKYLTSAFPELVDREASLSSVAPGPYGFSVTGLTCLHVATTEGKSLVVRYLADAYPQLVGMEARVPKSPSQSIHAASISAALGASAVAGMGASVGAMSLAGAALGTSAMGALAFGYAGAWGYVGATGAAGVERAAGAVAGAVAGAKRAIGHWYVNYTAMQLAQTEDVKQFLANFNSTSRPE